MLLKINIFIIFFEFLMFILNYIFLFQFSINVFPLSKEKFVSIS